MSGPLQPVEGVVLRLIEYGESDLVVGLLTPTLGKISAFAAGARVSRKRFGGALDLFNLLKVELRAPKDTHGNLWRIARVELVEMFLGLRNDLRRLAAASYLADCLWTFLGDGDPHPQVYDWWKTTLERLSKEEVSVALDLRLELEMLSMCGFAPHWDQCLDCGSRPEEGKVFFSFLRGGIICEKCRKTGEGSWIDADSVKRVHDGQKISMETAASLRRVLNAFVSHTMGREPKSQRFREEVFNVKS